MSEENKVDTPSDEKDPTTDPAQKDTPTEGQEGAGSEASKGENSEKSDQNGDLTETIKGIGSTLKKIEGRLTKVEQARKKSGKTAEQPRKPGSRFSFEEPEEDDKDPDKGALAQEDAVEFAKVQTGTLRLIMSNEKFAKVYQSDKTLQKIINKDPLQLLDDTPIDADDALSSIQEYLESRAEELEPDDKKKNDKPDKNPAPKPAGQEPDKKESPDKKDEPRVSATDKVKGSIMNRINNQG